MPNWKKLITSGSDAVLGKLTLDKSGSTVLDIQGSQGQLFSITDDLSGDLFSVADISGIPILNVNASGDSYFADQLEVQGLLTGSTADFSTAVSASAFSGSFFGDGSGLTGLDANLLDGLDSTAFSLTGDTPLFTFDSTANLASPSATTGTWTTANTTDWGTPRIGSSVARHNDGTGTLSFAVPTGMKTAYISQLTWSTGGYMDVYGVQSDGGEVFLRRINTKQNVENTNEGNPNQHDGSTIAFAGHIGDFPTILLHNKVGRFHITGLGFSKSELAASDGTGIVNYSQLTGTVPTWNQDTTGNASTVTTNANLTGHITSTGNAAVLGSFTTAQLNTAISDGTINSQTLPTDFVSAANGGTFGGTITVSGNLDLSGGTGKKIILGTQRSYTLPAQGTKMRILTLSNSTSCRVYIDSSENAYNQPIVLDIFYNSAGSAKPVIHRDNNYQWHTHSNDIRFTSDTSGHIYAEKVTQATGRSVNIRKVEEFKGSVTLLDGSTTTTGGGSNEVLEGRFGTLQPNTLVIGGHSINDIDITSEVSDADDHLMTALAIKNKIEDYGYTGDQTLPTDFVSAANGGTFSGAITVSSAITASHFKGDGSALTGVSVAEVTTVVDSFSSQTSVATAHNFGTKNVLVNVYDSNDAYIIPSSITTTNDNTVTTTFNVSTSGRVVVAKGGHVVNGTQPGVGTIAVDTFTGDGSTVAYTLTNGDPDDENLTMIYIQGVYQAKGNYSLSGSVITFSSAPDSGDAIEILSLSAALTGNAVTSVNGSTGAVVVDTKPTVSVINTNTTATANKVYVLTASLTLTLPSSPSSGDSIKISNRSGAETCILGRNGSKILGTSEDLTLDKASASFELIYADANNGWIIIGQ